MLWPPMLSAVLSDVATGLTSPESIILTAIVAPIVTALGLFARWMMRQNEKLQDELMEAYKGTLPVVEQCLATQHEMIEVSRTLADLLAQERVRPRSR